jgi:signal transduction histidine kinase
VVAGSDLKVATRAGRQITRQITVNSHWALQRDEAGNPTRLLELHLDITVCKRLEVERVVVLAASQNHARRLAEKAALKAGFTATMAHELAPSIAEIRDVANLLVRSAQDPDEWARLLTTI